MSDLIDRQDLINSIYNDNPKDVLVYIAEFPTAEPKKGKWEEKSTFDVDENGDSIIKEWQSAKCSVCGRYHTTPYMYYFDDYNYCPNCGADMRGEEDVQKSD